MDIEELKAEVERLQRECDSLRAERQLYGRYPPGHFYSPMPSIPEIRARERELFNVPSDNLPGIDLNENRQLQLLEAFGEYYSDQPFGSHKKEGLRYFFENPKFSYADAIVLYCFIRYAKPRKIVEIGSGFSSCVMLDINELFFNNAIDCTFVDPEPELLQSLLKEPDSEKTRIVKSQVQGLDLNAYFELSPGDILFVDSTHVSKVGSDVNRIFFEILPALRSGVYVHFHDIFYPFEYPRQWIYSGKAWNEAYLLRAFLQYNEKFEIQFFNSFMYRVHKEKWSSAMPLCMKNPGGSIWVKKK